jgi:hypothetical protein
MRITTVLGSSHAYLSTVPGEPNGIVLATLTPLWGMTWLVREFLEAPKDGPKYFTQCT